MRFGCLPWAGGRPAEVFEKPDAGVGTYHARIAGGPHAFQDAFQQIPAFVFVAGDRGTGDAGVADAV
ncbi:MAG TPA: hypothetical protein VLE22_19535 [Bryobacteraceae bacterium]|nr:hypothetical protein [Bryobacteraceae bacterium]